MLRNLKTERGIVLVVVLVLSAVVLAVMTALIYMITSGSQISGMQKRYRTASEAAQGGTELFYQIIGTRGDVPTLQATLASVPLPSDPETCIGHDVFTGATHTGFDAKLKTSSSTWSSSCNNSLAINTSDPSTYDFSYTVGTAPQYRYYAKIVNTIQGNSGSAVSSKLYTGGSGSKGGGGKKGSGSGSSSSGGSIPVVSRPYLYAIEVVSENSSNSAERAKYSILYEY